MTTIIIQYAFEGIGIYLICGLLFSIIFISKGLKVLDEGSHGSGIGFKLIIIPGCMIFWPVLLNKWIKLRKEIYLTQRRKDSQSR
ncbi:MAG: hypothetical protein QM737_01970 [Ferruginibacter sp.]